MGSEGQRLYRHGDSHSAPCLTPLTTGRTVTQVVPKLRPLFPLSQRPERQYSPGQPCRSSPPMSSTGGERCNARWLRGRRTPDEHRAGSGTEVVKGSGGEARGSGESLARRRGAVSGAEHSTRRRRPGLPPRWPPSNATKRRLEEHTRNLASKGPHGGIRLSIRWSPRSR